MGLLAGGDQGGGDRGGELELVGLGAGGKAARLHAGGAGRGELVAGEQGPHQEAVGAARERRRSGQEQRFFRRERPALGRRGVAGPEQQLGERQAGFLAPQVAAPQQGLLVVVARQHQVAAGRRHLAEAQQVGSHLRVVARFAGKGQRAFEENARGGRLVAGEKHLATVGLHHRGDVGGAGLLEKVRRHLVAGERQVQLPRS